MRIKLLTVILIILVGSSCWVVSAQSRLSNSEVDRVPFQAGPLKITIAKLRTSFLKLGNGFVEVDVQNTSSHFVTFSPQLLSLVNKDNSQANPYFTYYEDRYLPVADRKIAPGAWIRESYTLTRKVHLPARLYYDEKLLVEIVE